MSFLKSTIKPCAQQCYYSHHFEKLRAMKLIALVGILGCSPVNLLHTFRAPFPKSISGGLLLELMLHVASLQISAKILHSTF